jgi:probable rRNA maturation factor
MPIQIEVQRLSKETAPSLGDFKKWVSLAIAPKTNASLCIRLVDKLEIQGLNNQYRHKNKPTNVLSFPSQIPKALAKGYIGDLVLCPAILIKEAEEQRKLISAHWAHIVIHGTLHLLGYDHTDPEEALIMEALETKLIVKLGHPNPYGPMNGVDE